jgi:hypothetical protein
MTLETRKIKEVFPGVYWVLLWCPEAALLAQLLDPALPYVLSWGHVTGRYRWAPFTLPLTESAKPVEVLSRSIEFDYILPTARFLSLLPSLGPAIRAVQLKSLPPDYLDLARIKGKELYRLLAETGWHVLLDTPANDYGQLMSPHRHVLELALSITDGSDDPA